MKEIDDIREMADNARAHCLAHLQLIVYRAERELGLIEPPPETVVRTLRRK